jgi:predicted PurR-regulated permease PerM
MFALFAFGALFGFVGLLIAVPASAAIAVLVRFAISRYLQSPLYQGQAAEPAPPLPADRGGGHRSPRG